MLFGTLFCLKLKQEIFFGKWQRLSVPNDDGFFLTKSNFLEV